MITFVLALLLPWCSFGAPDPGDKPTRFGMSSGPLMPKGVLGVREIVPMTALRYATQTAMGLAEFETNFGNANGNQYFLLSARLVYDYELGEAAGLFYVGGDFHYFKTVRKIRTIFINGSTGESTETIHYEPGSFRRFNGWHLGFGVKMDVTSKLFLRADTFIRYSPGQTGYVGLGFEYLLEGSEGS